MTVSRSRTEEKPMELATPRPSYGLFDVDTHCYEQADSFSRHIPAKFKDRVVEHGAFGAQFAGEVFKSNDSKTGEGGLVMRPGSLKDFLRQMKSGTGEPEYQMEEMKDYYLYRDARLVKMDEQGVDACLLFPTAGVMAEAFIKDTDDLYANMHSFNEWYDEEWGFNHDDRIYAPPWISFRDLDRAVAEVEWALDRGARVFALRTGPQYGHQAGDPYFDPIFARLDEAGATLAYHLTECGYNENVGVWFGEDPDVGIFDQSAWQWCNLYCDRAMMDTASALVYSGLFTAFPNLKVASVEHGAEWVPYLTRRMDKMRGMGRNGNWPRGQLTERPSEIFRRHIVVAAYPEDDIERIRQQMGHVDSIALGSDYPHAEGAAEPMEFYEQLDGLSPEDERKVMRDNGFRLVEA
jgi:predicted TIM-barrel fold metal-dependent hydrolase